MSEAKQHYKDRRAVCNFCPSNPECVRIRTSVHCGDCPTALVCATKSELGRQNCEFVRGLWKALPCKKCMLVASLLAQYPGNHEVFLILISSTSVEERTLDAVLCPRCEEAQSIVSVDHSWLPLKGRTTTYVTVCNICGVNETFELTKPKH